MTGATGYIGKHLSSYLTEKGGHRVIPLGRSMFREGMSGLLIQTLAHCDVVINLAGAPINKRWTPEYKQELFNSRIVVTHRIVSISADRSEFVTKGDANNTEDEPISADQIIGQYSGRIPKVGDFALFLQKPLGMVIFIGVPVCAFVVWDILRRRRETRAGDEEKEQLRRELERLKAEKPAE